MTGGRPTFFGPASRRAFAMLHVPDPDQVRAPVDSAVVLCPPLGYEGVCAQAALVSIGDRLAAAGLCAMRIDYDGTGNSIGSDEDPDRLARWQASVHDAVDYLLAAGFHHVTLLGIRVGATFACAVASERDDVRGLVLWDPVLSGRRYVRALTLMAATGPGAGDPSGAVSVAGITFTPSTLGDLKALRLDPARLPADCLVVEPSEGATEQWPTEQAPSATVLRLPGTAGLLDTDVELAVVPDAIVEGIVDWEVRRARRDVRVAVVPELAICDRAEETVDGVRLEHRAVRWQPDDVFATLTRPLTGACDRAVIMLNNGSAAQLGPGRAWVEWSRELAAGGALVVRLDFSGLGSSPAVDGARSGDSYPLAAGRNIRDAVREVRAMGIEHVALLGLCSGSLLSLDGLVLTPDVDAVVAINGRFDKPWTHRRRERGLRAGGRTSRVLAVPLRKGPLHSTFDRVPRWMWWLLDRLHLVASPVRALQAVRSHRAEVLLVFGTDERGLRALQRRGGKEFADVLDSGRVHMARVEGLDHSMFARRGRLETFAVVQEFLRSPASPAGGPGDSDLSLAEHAQRGRSVEPNPS